MEARNEVILKGTLVGKSSGKGDVRRVTIATTKYKSRKGEVHQNYPRVTFNNKEISSIIDGYSIGSKVYIKGKIIISGTRNGLKQSIYGDTISLISSRNTEDFFETTGNEARNEIRICGILKGLYAKNDKISYIRVNVPGLKNDINIELQMYQNINYFSKYHIGDSIMALGTYVTTKKGTENQNPNFVDEDRILISEIIKCTNKKEQ